MSHRLAAAALIAIVVATAIALISRADQARADSPGGDASVRVIARMAPADRLEFGLRVDARTELPQLRFVSRSIEDHRWLRSSVIELDSGRSVRVLARRLADGRFETALRIVGVEEILQPRLRFIAAELTHDRWLRSSEIIIPAADAEPGEAAAGGGVLTTGADHSCAVTADGSLECWGSNEFGQSDPPAGQYSEVSAGSRHTCALTVAGEVRCWGESSNARTAAPEGRYTSIDAGYDHTCALSDSGEIMCWGWDEDGPGTPPPGRFTAVSAGRWHSCALDDAGELTCWGGNDWGQSERRRAASRPSAPAVRTPARWPTRVSCTAGATAATDSWSSRAGSTRRSAPAGGTPARSMLRANCCAAAGTGSGRVTLLPASTRWSAPSRDTPARSPPRARCAAGAATAPARPIRRPASTDRWTPGSNTRAPSLSRTNWRVGAPTATDKRTRPTASSPTSAPVARIPVWLTCPAS